VLYRLAEGFDGGRLIDGRQIVDNAFGGRWGEGSFDFAPVLGELSPGTR
jgi:hypothetical protein